MDYQRNAARRLIEFQNRMSRAAVPTAAMPDENYEEETKTALREEASPWYIRPASSSASCMNPMRLSRKVRFSASWINLSMLQGGAFK